MSPQQNKTCGSAFFRIDDDFTKVARECKVNVGNPIRDCLNISHDTRQHAG